MNKSLRQYAKNHGVYLWEIARFFNVSEMTITRKFRTELPEEEKSKYKYAIDQISRQKESDC